MNFRGRLAAALMVLIISCATKWVEAESTKPPPSMAFSSSVVVMAEEPRGVLCLRDVLRLTLIRNPELQAFTFELRAAEARTIQAGVLPNPAVSAEVENIG